MNGDIKDLLQMIKTCSKNLDSKLTLDTGCCKYLIDYIDELHNKINKAIELLENCGEYYDSDFESMKFQYDVIKILKDSDVDE